LISILQKIVNQIYILDWKKNWIIKSFKMDLTPKGPLSIRETNGISGRYLHAKFLLWFFETFFEDRKIDCLQGLVNFFQSVPVNKNYAQISSKQGRGDKKKFKIWISFWEYFSLIDYIFVCMESFDSFHLDLLWENYEQSCFLGNKSIFLKK